MDMHSAYIQSPKIGNHTEYYYWHAVTQNTFQLHINPKSNESNALLCGWLMVFLVFVVVCVCAYNVYHSLCNPVCSTAFIHSFIHSCTGRCWCCYFFSNSTRSNQFQNTNATKYTQSWTETIQIHLFQSYIINEWQTIYWWMVFALWNLHSWFRFFFFINFK